MNDNAARIELTYYPADNSRERYRELVCDVNEDLTFEEFAQICNYFGAVLGFRDRYLTPN